VVSVPWGTASYREGTVSVMPADAQFAVSLEAFPVELDGGGMVWFTVHVRNFENTALSLSGFVEDEDGAVIKRIDGFEGRIPANGEKNITFSYTVYGVGNHTFKLFLDNYDGKPNGKGEDHWAEVTVEVRAMNGTELKQVGSECSDLYFTWELIDYHAALTCRAVLYNPTDKTLVIANTSAGKPKIGIIPDGVVMTPSSFEKHLSKFSVTVSNAKIPPQGDTVITFKSEISGVPLLVLEYYWGTYYTITIPYDVHLNNGSTPNFTLTGSGQITQNNYEVAADIGVNIFLFKGVGNDIKAVIILGKSAELGSVARDFMTIGKEIVGWILWWKS